MSINPLQFQLGLGSPSAMQTRMQAWHQIKPKRETKAFKAYSAMLRLADTDFGGRMTTREVARVMDKPENYLSQPMKDLRDAGWILAAGTKKRYWTEFDEVRRIDIQRHSEAQAYTPVPPEILVEQGNVSIRRAA